MSGMVFLSKGFGENTVGYNALTAIVSAIVIVSMIVFMSFVVFEVYRSIKYAKLHERARAAEAERVERGLLQATRKKRMLALARLQRMQQSGDSAVDAAVSVQVEPGSLEATGKTRILHEPETYRGSG